MTHLSNLADIPLLDTAGQALSDENVDELLRRQVHPESSERKRSAKITYDIYRSCYEAHVLDGIRIQQNSETIRRDMARFLTKVRNDARDVTEQIAVVWQNGADRHLVAEGGGEDEDGTKAIRSLAKQSRFDTVAAMANHLAWLQGPQFMVPMVRGGKKKRLCTDLLSPHIYDIVQDIDDPLGDPVGLAWHLSHRQIGPNAVEDDIFILDAVSLRRFKVRSPSSGQVATEQMSREELPAVVHDYGKLPASYLRFTDPIAGDDWFLCEENSRLTTGTIEVAVKMARMGLVRRAQNHKLLTLIGAVGNMPKGQEKGDPEGQVIAPTERGTGQVDIDVHDYDTPPTNFILEILFWVQSMVEPLGGRVRVDSGEPQIFGRIEIPHEVQVEHRDGQVQPATDTEQTHWAAATHVAKAAGLPEAIALPKPEVVEDNLRVDFGQLSRAMKDPEKQTVHEDWMLAHGQTSEVEIMRKRLGGASREEAQKEIERNLEDRAWYIDALASRNVPAGGDGEAMTAAQANGAMGTPAREANRDAPEAGRPGGAEQDAGSDDQAASRTAQG